MKHLTPDNEPLDMVHITPDWRSSERGILTVGQLMRWLKTLPPETQVVVGDDGGWYNNIEGVQLPDGESTSAVTFVQGEAYDTRQV
jgi:hypothetical protein